MDEDRAGIITTLSRLSPLIQGVLIAAVGTVATIVYNQRQLQLAQLAALDKYRTYLASESPEERIFGYEAFVALGQEKFVIRLIAAKQDVAAKQVLTSVASSSDDEATRKEAAAKLNALLADSEKQASLGRREMARQELDEVLRSAPENEVARLRRDTLEDWQYLTKVGSKLSAVPYLRLAQHTAQHEDKREARTLLEQAAVLFDDVRVFDVLVKYNPAEIDMATVRDSLTLQAADESWEQPPSFLSDSSFQDGDHLFIWTQEGSSSGLNLRFERFGFDPVALRATAADLKAPSFLGRELTVHRGDTAVARNVLQGTVKLQGTESADGVTVSVVDNYSRNRGFQKTAVSQQNGAFTINDVPDGQFEISFEKTGYVPFGLSVTVKRGVWACLVDRQRHFSKNGIQPCQLGGIDIRLYRIRALTLRWTLQEQASARHFRGSVSSGDAHLSTGLPDDWSRGGWGCCKATFKFGSRTIDDPETDLVVFTETDGQIYFAQPHRPFIAEASQDFESLVEIPQSLTFTSQAAVVAGKTYVLTTSPPDDDDPKSPRFFVKMKVVAVE